MAINCKIIKPKFLKSSSLKKNDIKNLISTMNSIKIDIIPKFVEVDRLNNLKELPKKNEGIFIMTNKNINYYEILEKIDNELKIKKIHASFNVINEKGYDYLKKYNVETILISNHDFKENEKSIELKSRLLCGNIKKKPQHTKLLLCECENENYIAINGSANPSVSSKIESYIIYNSKEYYTFLKMFINEEKLECRNEIEIEKNNVFSFISVNSLTSFDVIKKIEKSNKIKSISLIQFTDGIISLKKLEEFIKGRNIKLRFYLSNRIKIMNQSTYKKIKTMSDYIKDNNATHCKMHLIESEKEKHVIVSTANYFSNKKLEITEVISSSDLYDNILNFCEKHF